VARPEWRESIRRLLTAYAVDTGVYDRAISKGFLRIDRPKHSTPEFIGRFSSAYQEHYHYSAGIRTD
jgi:hypothetical protein